MKEILESKHYYNFEEYIVDLENSKVYIKSYQKWVNCSEECINTLKRMHWCEEKNNEKHLENNCSIDEELTDVVCATSSKYLPEEDAINAIDNDVLNDALATLSSKKRKYITDYYLNEMSYTDIARANNDTRQSVTYSINSGLKQLKNYMTDREYEF